MKKVISIIIVIIVAGFPFLQLNILPVIGDENSPANTNVSVYYIENGEKDTNAANLVTAVLADYRGFDTLLETTVMFLAGLGVVLILYGRPKSIVQRRQIPNRISLANRTESYKSMNKDVIIPLVVPMIIVYAAYVLFHGEVSLGGGFQAGALLALAYTLDVLVVPDNQIMFILNKMNAVVIAGIGTGIYGLVGMASMLNGGSFLEYSKLPFRITDVPELHSLGIMLIEIGVTIGVMATIIGMLDAILERNFGDDRTDQ